MIKEALQYLVSLKDNKTYEINGHTYSDTNLCRIDPPRYYPESIAVNGLDSICKLVREEIEAVGKKVYIQASSHNIVDVFTTYDDQYKRAYLYRCRADVPPVTTGRFMPYENAVIELRSLYIPNDDISYLLNLLSSISSESKIVSNDNGVTQQVEAKKGIALSSMVTVKQRVELKPFRTFLEVNQPESEFILRIDDDGRIGFFEADGGVWKLEAKKNIAAYFEAELQDLIEEDKVVVIR